ncbi:MAG: hypothetical protein ACR2I0_11420, partial [Rhodoferax sp.]
MHSEFTLDSDRRRFLSTAGTLSAGVLIPGSFANAQSSKIRIGLMLPYTGTYAALGNAITNGLNLEISENGGLL